jgi:phosphate-selective porin OprO/OprP
MHKRTPAYSHFAAALLGVTSSWVPLAHAQEPPSPEVLTAPSTASTASAQPEPDSPGPPPSGESAPPLISPAPDAATDLSILPKASSAQGVARDAASAQPVPASAPVSSAEVRADEKGFALCSAGDPPAFVLKLGATVQADGRLYFDDEQKDNVLLRRVRPILAGTVIGLVDYYLMPDFGGGQTALFDAYLDAHPWPWLRLRAGKFKAPIGLERLQTDSDLPLPERALTSNLSPIRDVGAQLWGEVAEGILTYALAVLDGSPDLGNIDQDTGGSKDLAARIFVQPFKKAPELGVLGFGLAATTGGRNGSPKATNLLGLKTIGQTTLFAYLAPATDVMGTGTVFASGRESRLNPELYYYHGPFGLLGEAIWSRQEVHKGNANAVLTHAAWHATASYVIGGNTGFTGPMPDYPWSPSEHHFGALEIAARYSWIDFDDRAFPLFSDPSTSATQATGIGGAVTWLLSRTVQIATSFEHTRFEGGAKNAGHRKDEQLLLTRAQLNF